MQMCCFNAGGDGVGGGRLLGCGYLIGWLVLINHVFK